MINASGNDHGLFVVVVGGYGVVNSVSIGFLGPAMRALDKHLINGLLPGEKQVPEQPTKNEQRQAEKSARSSKKTVSKQDSTQRKSQREASAPSDTAGLSANIQTTGLTAPGSSGPTLSGPLQQRTRGKLRRGWNPQVLQK